VETIPAEDRRTRHRVGHRAVEPGAVAEAETAAAV